ncbi:hypothetical protein D6C95_03000 [Aureobasidium pullulans]|nr:hypothetical protein D6C95_03000 [Aureobasidium pullulans]
MFGSLLILLPVIGIAVQAAPWQSHSDASSIELRSPTGFPRMSRVANETSIGTGTSVSSTVVVSSTTGLVPPSSQTASTTDTASTSTNATSTSSTPTAYSSQDACASVSTLVKAFTIDMPPLERNVPAEIAYQCLHSIPFNQTAALDLLKSIRPYMEWQTTLSYVKDPPKEYALNVQPGFDFWKAFDAVEHNVVDGVYKSEYDFGWDLYQANQQVHDGHFTFVPDSVGKIFIFGRTTPLVSVSDDGKSLPVVYAYADIVASSFGNSTFQPSPITMIDGQNTTQFLEDWSQYGTLQDRDALWNNLFYSPAQVSLGTAGTSTGTFVGRGRGRFVYPGANTTFSFANGSTITHENFAKVLVDFKNISSGADIYKQYFIVTPRAYANASEINKKETNNTIDNSKPDHPEKPAAMKTVPAPGYPTPILRQRHNINGGYFLDQPGFEHVAVLTVGSFVSNEGQEVEFQNINDGFIAAAKAANKTKLIIDLSANGGGTILQGYDLFKQLFPNLEPYGGTRFRAHTALDNLGEMYSEAAAPYTHNPNQTDKILEVVSSSWNYRSDMDVNGKPFSDWEAKYGPHQHGPSNDSFTSIIRWNLTDPLQPLNSGGIYVSGYQGRSNITTPPWQSEDIILVYDGYCASTCAIFAEFMHRQANVKTIALGGRPTTHPMQGVGGVKGTNTFPLSYIFTSITSALSWSDPWIKKSLNDTVLTQYTQLPMARSGSSPSVNSRDGIRHGDEGNLPLQFLYEPADCRIFYTAAMVVDQSAVWRTVADTVWGKGNACVAGDNNFNGDEVSEFPGFAEKDGGRGSGGEASVDDEGEGEREDFLQHISADIDVEEIWEGLQQWDLEDDVVMSGTRGGECITLP